MYLCKLHASNVSELKIPGVATVDLRMSPSPQLTSNHYIKVCLHRVCTYYVQDTTECYSNVAALHHYKASLCKADGIKFVKRIVIIIF